MAPARAKVVSRPRAVVGYGSLLCRLAICRRSALLLRKVEMSRAAASETSSTARNRGSRRREEHLRMRNPQSWRQCAVECIMPHRLIQPLLTYGSASPSVFRLHAIAKQGRNNRCQTETHPPAGARWHRTRQAAVGRLRYRAMSPPSRDQAQYSQVARPNAAVELRLRTHHGHRHHVSIV